jgi:hypothetical protein
MVTPSLAPGGSTKHGQLQTAYPLQTALPPTNVPRNLTPGGDTEVCISRKSVRKMVSFSVLPGYQRQQPVKRPQLDPWVA